MKDFHTTQSPRINNFVGKHKNIFILICLIIFLGFFTLATTIITDNKISVPGAHISGNANVTGNLNITGKVTASYLRGIISWDNLTDYPTACNDDEVITMIGDTITCTRIAGLNISHIQDIYLLNSGDIATGDYTFDTNTLFIDAANDRIGIGTTSPKNTLNVVGNFNITNLTGVSAGTLGLYQNIKAKVGIGTASPGSKLDVRGAIRATDWTNASSAILWTTGFNATGDTRWYLKSNPFGFYNSSTLVEHDPKWSANKTLVAFLSEAETIAGNWVNTANPWEDNEVSNTLTINSSGSVTWSALTSYPTACNDDEVITMIGDTITCTRIAGLNISHIQDIYLLNSGDTGTGNYNFVGTFNITNGTGGIYGLFFNSKNFVGIGTASPVTSLHIDSGVNTAPDTTGSSTPDSIIRLEPTGSNVVLDIGILGSPTYAWIQPRLSSDYSANYNLALNPNGGNVGIGTSNPKNTLNVAGNTNITGSLIMGSSTISASDISIIDNGVIALTTETSGNYVGDVAAGSGISVSATPDEGYTETIALDYGTNLLGWSNLTRYPTACSASQYISAFGDTLSCSSIAISDTQVADTGKFLLATGDTATGDYNFGSGTFFIDSVNNKIGIGTTSPKNTLNVVGDGNFTGIIYSGGNIVLTSINITNNLYTKTQVDNNLTTRYFSRTQTGTLLGYYYNKTQTNNIFGYYYNKTQTNNIFGYYYNKTQSDNNLTTRYFSRTQTGTLLGYYYNKTQSDNNLTTRYVPYTGASANVNLGTKNLTAAYLNISGGIILNGNATIKRSGVATTTWISSTGNMITKFG